MANSIRNLKNINDKKRELLLRREKRIRDCRRSFWDFCRTLHPDFYTDSRPHLKRLCTVLQLFFERKLTGENGKVYTKLMINMPPRFGKSRTLFLFCMWILGIVSTTRIIACSYNDNTASDFSRYTRDGIKEQKARSFDIDYNDIFPNSTIKRGNASFEKWALDGEFFNYLGAGIKGSITGKGGNVVIIDDPIKDAEEAFNELLLDKIEKWYTGTFLSRKEEGALEIMNMTRWSKKDLCGRRLFDDNGNPKPSAQDWYILQMEACDESGNMLCDELLSRESYENKKSEMDNLIFLANYHQMPVEAHGALYKDLKKYIELPQKDGKILFDRIISYCDTADEGNDYLCNIIAGQIGKEAYILDVYYTKSGMEITEPATALKLIEYGVNYAKIESNNGGRGFARALKKLIREDYKNNSIDFSIFTQSKNKMARILANSNHVMKHIYFPVNWSSLFPEFYRDITNFQREGKNKHDDAPDALTGIAEIINQQVSEVIIA